MGRRDLQSLSPRLRGTKRTLNMYIWRDNSVRSHGSREAEGESQALRGIIQFQDFPVQGSKKNSFLKGSGLHSPAIHVLTAEMYHLFSPFISLLSPPPFTSFLCQLFLRGCACDEEEEHASQESQPHFPRLFPVVSVTYFTFMFHCQFLFLSSLCTTNTIIRFSLSLALSFAYITLKPLAF